MNGREDESEELLCCSAMEVTEIGAHLPRPFVVTSITEVLLAQSQYHRSTVSKFRSEPEASSTVRSLASADVK